MIRGEAKDIIEKKFLDGFVSGVPISFDNVEFDPPEGEWVRFQVRFNSGDQFSMGIKGNRRFRREGIILITVNVPLNTGTFRAEELAEAALDVFEGIDISTISFESGTYVTLGRFGSWHQVVATLDFWFDEIK